MFCLSELQFCCFATDMLVFLVVFSCSFCFTALTFYQRYCALLKLCLQELLQIQSSPTQATRDLSSSNRGRLLNQVCSSFEESKSFVFDGRLDALVVAEVL